MDSNFQSTKDLITEDGTRLNSLDKNYKYYLNKTTLLFGMTGSGKSTLLDEIMILLKPFVPVVFVVAPTNNLNNMYTNKVPKSCIQDGRNMEKLVNWINKFVDRQNHITELYAIANNLEELRSLFIKVNDNNAIDLEKEIIRRADDALIYVDGAQNLNLAQKKKQKENIKNDRDKFLKKMYKTCIRHHSNKLEKRDDLSKRERVALTFLDINPNALLILDDAASLFKILYKKCPNIKTIFYNGRHMNISTIITSQDDKDIDSELRKNSMISFFTTSQIATSNFGRASNGYNKSTRDKARMCIDVVFKENKLEDNYQKLVYVQNTNNPFRYVIADLYPEYRMCSDSMWELEDKINEGKNSESALDNNPFFNKYSM